VLVNFRRSDSFLAEKIKPAAVSLSFLIKRKDKSQPTGWWGKAETLEEEKRRKEREE
jgi:hypothetical protein